MNQISLRTFMIVLALAVMMTALLVGVLSSAASAWETEGTAYSDCEGIGEVTITNQTDEAFMASRPLHTEQGFTWGMNFVVLNEALEVVAVGSAAPGESFTATIQAEAGSNLIYRAQFGSEGVTGPGSAEWSPLVTIPVVPVGTCTPDTSTPDTTIPDTTIPEVTEPEVTEPEVTTPDTSTSIPEVTTPDTSTPDTTIPEGTSTTAEVEILPVTGSNSRNPAIVGLFGLILGACGLWFANHYREELEA